MLAQLMSEALIKTREQKLRFCAIYTYTNIPVSVQNLSRKVYVAFLLMWLLQLSVQ